MATEIHTDAGNLRPFSSLASDSAGEKGAAQYQSCAGWQWFISGVPKLEIAGGRSAEVAELWVEMTKGPAKRRALSKSLPDD